MTRGGLFHPRMFVGCHAERPARFERVIVSVSPGMHAEDAHGLVVAGRSVKGMFVLDVAVLRGPRTFASVAADWARHWSADAIVSDGVGLAGSEMIRSVLCAAAPPCRVEIVKARRRLYTLAEPVAAAYEAGFIRHCRTFQALEDELLTISNTAMGDMPLSDALVTAFRALNPTWEGAL